MIIELQDQFISQLGLSAEDVLLRIALMLFVEEKISLAKAARLSRLHPIQFQDELTKRKLPIHYDIADFDRDLETIEQLYQ